MKKTSSYQSNDSNKKQNSSNSGDGDMDFYQLRSQTQISPDYGNKVTDEAYIKIKDIDQTLQDISNQNYDLDLDMGQLTLNSAISSTIQKPSQKKHIVQQQKFKSIIFNSSKKQCMPMAVEANLQSYPEQNQNKKQNNYDEMQSLCSSLIRNPNNQHKIVLKGIVCYDQFDDASELQSNYFKKDVNGTENVIRRNIMLRPMNGAKILQQRSKSKGFRPGTGSANKRNIS